MSLMSPLLPPRFPYTTLFRSALPDPPTDPDATRWIYYSSGTTSDPKGARHSDATVSASSNGVVDEMGMQDRKSTRLNSSHLGISYAVFCLKKKKKHTTN